VALRYLRVLFLSGDRDSHIYRVHTAQCCGCKKPMKSQEEFQIHRNGKILALSNSKCTSYEGLFENEIENLRKLKVKGLGLKRSWEEVYKTLFPTSLPIPTPCRRPFSVLPEFYSYIQGGSRLMIDHTKSQIRRSCGGLLHTSRLNFNVSMTKSLRAKMRLFTVFLKLFLNEILSLHCH